MKTFIPPPLPQRHGSKDRSTYHAACCGCGYPPSTMHSDRPSSALDDHGHLSLMVPPEFRVAGPRDSNLSIRQGCRFTRSPFRCRIHDAASLLQGPSTLASPKSGCTVQQTRPNHSQPYFPAERGFPGTCSKPVSNTLLTATFRSFHRRETRVSA